MENKREDGLIDVGCYLSYCGHRVIKAVWQGEISHKDNKTYFYSENNYNQYVLPLNAIEFVVPHEEDILCEEERNDNENRYKTNTGLL